MKNYLIVIILMLSPALVNAKKNTTLNIIAKEPVTMMDLGIIKLNASFSRLKQRELQGANISADYNARKGTIDIKVSKPVKKASRYQCQKLVNDTKKIFLKRIGKKNISNIHHYFQHQGTNYTRRINWDDLPNHVVVFGIALTKKNYQDSVYCKSKLMKKKVTY